MWAGAHIGVAVHGGDWQRPGAQLDQGQRLEPPAGNDLGPRLAAMLSGRLLPELVHRLVGAGGADAIGTYGNVQPLQGRHSAGAAQHTAQQAHLLGKLHARGVVLAASL
jgi:hypothetical protein